MRIGIVQSVVGIVGGQDRALFSLIPKLKSAGHDVTLLTYSKPLCSIPDIPIKTVIPIKIRFFGIYQKALHFNSESFFKDYDILISTTGAIINSSKPIIYYDQNNIFNLDIVSTPKYQSGIWKLYFMPYKKIMKRSYEIIKQRSNIRFISNSEYTKSLLQKKVNSDVGVIYPPVNLSEFSDEQVDKHGVAMVSRISPEKNLVFAIDVLNKLDRKSTIFGNVISGTKSYANHLKEIAGSKVTLMFNQPRNDLVSLLKHSKVFFHAGDETFGIAVVEGIASGCIPVVPDTTANKETVPFDVLRYNPGNVSDALGKLTKALNGEFDYLLPQLKTHIKQFDESVFQERMLHVIEQKKVLLA